MMAEAPFTVSEFCPLHVFSTRHHATGATERKALRKLRAELNQCREEYERRGRVPYGAGIFAYR